MSDVDEAADGGGVRTPLTELLGIEHPILLAPMDGVAGGRLAGAVSRAGGLGLVGGGYADPVWLERELDDVGDAHVGVGFISFALAARPAALTIALERRPVAIQLSFGDPAPFVDAIKAAGAKVICQVTRRDEAIRAAECGADVIVAQGQDSGGHGRSGRGTISLVPAVADAVAPLPVVAAGGIGDGRGLAAALVLGASGVTLGTRLLASVEAVNDEASDALLVARGGDDTVRTSAIDVVRGPAWPAGHDGRVVRNRLTDRWSEISSSPTELEAQRAAYRSSAEDDYTIRALWAGEALDMVDAIEPAGTIIARIVQEARRALHSGAVIGGLGRDR